MTYSRPPKGKHRAGSKKDLGPALMIVISLTILILCGVGYTIYELKAHPDVGANFTSYTSRIKQWWVDRKERLGQGLANVKKAAHASNDTVPVVKFEFYNTLPEMQMMADSEKQIERTIANKAAAVTLEPKPEIAEQVAKKLAQVAPVEVAHKVAPKKSIATRNVSHKKIAKKTVARKKVAQKKSVTKRHLARKKPVKIVVSRAADLENDLLATMKNTAGGK